MVKTQSQNSLAFLVPIWLIVMSCSNGTGKGEIKDTSGKIVPQKQVTKSSDANNAKLFESSLNILYLQNSTANHDLQDLLKQSPGNSVDKLVFNFIGTEDGELSLIVFASEKGNKKFHTKAIKTLIPFKKSGITLGGEQVVLGNQEIENLKPLKDSVNASSCKYIVFTPDTVAKNGFIFIKYHLTGVRSLTEVSLLPVDISDTKPSPPASAF